MLPEKRNLVSMLCCALILITASSALTSGQTLKCNHSHYSSDSGPGVFRILVEPGSSVGWIEIEESCLELLSEVEIEMSFPFGEPFPAKLSVGQRYSVPKGKYEIANSRDFAIEFRLWPGTTCKPIKDDL